MVRRKETAPVALARYGEALADASRDFAVLCDRLDATEDDAQFKALMSEFASVQDVVENRIDRFAAMREIVLGQVERDKKRAAQIRERAKRLESMMDRADAAVLERIAADPDKPWSGGERKLCRQANGQAALVVALATDNGESAVKDVNVADVVDSDTSLAIDDRFIEVRSYAVLNRKAVRAALEAGEELPWAKLARGHHLRVREV